MPPGVRPRHEIAVALIVDADGRLLLQLRDDKPDIPNPGRWGFFGGHIEPGERPPAALLRELDEELAWRPRHFEPWVVREVEGEASSVVSHAFAVHLDVPLSALRLGEGQDLALFAPDELPPDAAPSIVPVVREFAASQAYVRMRKHYRYLATTALLVDAGGRFLLQLRDDKPEIQNPGRWGSFGGALEPYETPHDGFVRELEEELSWQPASFDLYGGFPYYDAGLGADHLVYVFTAPLDVPLSRLRLNEGQDMAAFAPDALPETTVPALRSLIARFVREPAYSDLARAAAEAARASADPA